MAPDDDGPEASTLLIRHETHCARGTFESVNGWSANAKDRRIYTDSDSEEGEDHEHDH